MNASIEELDNDSTIEEISFHIESFRSDNTIDYLQETVQSELRGVGDEEDNYSYDDFTDNEDEINQEIINANNDGEYSQDDFDDDLVSNITTPKANKLYNTLNFVQNSKTSTALGRNTPTRNGVKKNMSFTTDRLREIDRHNKILLRKILDKTTNSKSISRDSSSNSSLGSSSSNSRISSAAINRKKEQKKIDYENQLLLKKLQQIRRRKVTC